MSGKTPILILAYNRPENIDRLLSFISTTPYKSVYLSVDGPKNNKDSIAIKKIKELAKKYSKKLEIKTNFFKKNHGLKKAVTKGIDWFFTHHEAGIILEDDLIVSPSFFPFCEELLVKYKDEKQVIMISGSNFFPWINHNNDYFFSKHALIWGWATWKRSWQNFRKLEKQFNSGKIKEEDLTILRNKTSKQRINFGLKSLEGKLDSWAYIWGLTMYLENGFTIIPAKNMILNDGFGLSATHTKFKTFHGYLPIADGFKISKHPKFVSPDRFFDLLFQLSDNRLVLFALTVFRKIA